MSFEALINPRTFSEIEINVSVNRLDMELTLADKKDDLVLVVYSHNVNLCDVRHVTPLV